MSALQIPQIMEFKEYRRNLKEYTELWALAGFRKRTRYVSKEK